MDYYQQLQLNRDASQDEIKQAYRRLALLYHPDKNGGQEEQFKQLHEAYQILRDPVTRKEYDETLGNGDDMRLYMEFFDTMVSPLFEKWKEELHSRKKQKSVKNEKMQKNEKNTKNQGEKSDFFEKNTKCSKTTKCKKNVLRLKLQVTLDELFAGTTKKLVYKIRRCDGEITTKNAFVSLCSGEREFYFVGEGDEIEPNVYGDVCIFLEIENHSCIKISESNIHDLHICYPITLYDLYYGIDVKLPYLQGEVLHIKKNWFQDKKQLCFPDDHVSMMLEIQDYGLPYLDGDHVVYGSLFVFFQLTLPKLSKSLLHSYEFCNGIKKYFKNNED